ncbi:xylulokinase [Arcanobacterium phocae]|uniref:Xylulose kinase n=1 Tax=Arcanobacterium phocae TaxID=131112 RepID=A0A1H2LFF7_9ACTO|nr:xylulokinase [Arcanobacterium phocae]SDU79564.1 xylulokinase [Arcanobacterium phocae]
MNFPYVAGVDSSTQSCKVIVWDPQTQSVIRQGSAPHPQGTEVDPEAWWQAFLQASKEAGGLSDVAALSVGAQQHGMITLDASGGVIRPALLWNDTRSASAAKQLIDELGKKRWIESTGSMPVASLTVTKLRWLADEEPEAVKKLAAVCLPHDYLSWRIMGSRDIADIYTDRSDASGTGYFDLHDGGYCRDLLAHALRVENERVQGLVLPKVIAPFEAAATVKRDIPEIGFRAGTLLGPGCGDNAGAALGIGLGPREAALSIGTSGVVSVVSDHPVVDLEGGVNGFMDASGNWLSLVSTLNGARILSSTAELLGVDFADFDALALSVTDSLGLAMTPYFEGERTPNLPEAKACLTSMTLDNWKPQYLARAAVESLCLLMANALATITRCGIGVDRIYLIGGGAKSKAVREIIGEYMDVKVAVPKPAEYVALGAARQASAIL